MNKGLSLGLLIVGVILLIWGADADTTVNPPFRRASSEVRSHADVPLCELASLAALFAQDGGDREEVVRRMALEFDLGRFRSATRERFERAYDLAAYPLFGIGT